MILFNRWQDIAYGHRGEAADRKQTTSLIKRDAGKYQLKISLSRLEDLKASSAVLPTALIITLVFIALQFNCANII